MKIKLVYSVVALFVMCNQSAVAAEEEQSDFSARDVKPFIVLGYKPIISFYYPVPFTSGQLVPAGSPWPDSPEGYKTTIRPEPPPSLVNKFGKEGVEPVTVSEYIWTKPSSPDSTQKLSQKKTTTVNPTTILEYNPTKPPYISQSLIVSGIGNHTKIKPASVLDYKPTRPPYLPEPPTIGQLIPSGTPWPESPEGYQTTIKPTTTKVNPTTVLEYNPTKPPYISQSLTILSGIGNHTKVKPASVLDYKPTRPPYIPEPPTIGQLIPSGTPWPESPEGYQTTIKPTLNDTTTKVKPVTVLEYKPTRPSFLPEPTVIGQLIPPGTPWPDSPEGYSTTLKPSLENKFETDDNKSTNQKPATVLEYKPTRPSFLPEPLTIGQLIPSGTPWPDSPQGYSTTLKPSLENKFETDDNNSTNQKPATVLEYKPTRPSFLPEPSTIGQLIPSGTPLPDSPQGYSTTPKPSLENKFETDDNNSTNQKPATVLEYKPTRPSFLPEPSTIGQLIPSGTPWPDSPDGYSTTLKPPLENKFGIDNNKEKPATVLEYKPTRPSFVPEPSTIGQLIPPGKPWPASVDEYTTSPSQITNRFPEVTSKKPTTHLTQSTSSKSSSQTTHIILGYKPQRPWYLPEPVTIGQIVPPGKPWPASPEGYIDFSATKPRRRYD